MQFCYAKLTIFLMFCAKLLTFGDFTAPPKFAQSSVEGKFGTVLFFVLLPINLYIIVIKKGFINDHIFPVKLREKFNFHAHL